jgi:hypothetical protein
VCAAITWYYYYKLETLRAAQHSLPPPLKRIFVFFLFSLLFLMIKKERKSKRRNRKRTLSFSHVTDSILSKSVRDAYSKELTEGALLLPIESVFYHLMEKCVGVGMIVTRHNITTTASVVVLKQFNMLCWMYVLFLYF